MVEETLPASDNPTAPKTIDAPSSQAGGVKVDLETATSAPALAGKPSSSSRKRSLPLSRRLLNLLGHVAAALLGLTLGYLILRWFGRVP
jgi:hypothetical protein